MRVHPRFQRAVEQLSAFQGPIELVVDLVAWLVAAGVAVYLRFDLNPGHVDRIGLLKFLPLTAVVQCGVGMAVGLYRRRWRYGSYDEVAALAVTALIATVVLWAIDRNFLKPRLVPLSAVLMGGFVGLVLMAASRYVWRLAQERARRPNLETAERLLVFGAGDGGIQVITAMLRTPNSPYLPVALIDDDAAKRRLSIMGVSVMGTSADLADLARRLEARALLIAVPSAGPELITELTDAANAARLQVMVLPPVDELFGHPPGISDIRPVSELDLLGRHQIETDVQSIAGYITGRRVLVTGAGGSIGSELCRQLVKFAPAELMMLDRDESALHAVQLALNGRAFLDTPDVLLADLRDREAVSRIFLERRPQVVFHAAALKHLPMLQQYPSEAVKSNVWGTLIALEAAEAVGVERFVNISTDKAANPISVLGYSKRVAEKLTAHAASTANGIFLSVRFGNVLGSRGSVLTTFRAQIEGGGPITVTDPEVTRFFMTIQEAVQLVIQAGAIGLPGEVLVLDMGKPVRIDDVARRLAAQAKRPVRIEYTGLRHGEKLHEELFGEGEIDVRPKHRLISHALVPPLAGSAVVASLSEWTAEQVTTWLEELARQTVS